MNQIATQQQRIPMDSVGVTSSLTGSKIAPQNLGEVVKFAEVMARADIALPKHLRGNAGACMAVALQAMEWNLSPFAVASKSYAVNGAIAYEAQLIAAVVNTRSGIKGRLKYRYEGEGPSLTCTVSGTLDGEECTYTSPPMGSITTKNSPLWKSDPQQQLGYFAARSWARRHCPEVILGVYDRDEAEEFRGPDNAKNITPVFDPLSDEPVATQRPADEHHTFDGTFDADEAHDALTGEILPNTNSDDETPAPSSDNAGITPVDEAGADGSPTSDAPASTDPERDILIRFAAEMLPMAAKASTEAWKEVEKGWSEGEMKKLSAAGLEKAKAISMSLRAIAKGNTSLESAVEYYAEVLDATVEELGGVDG